jgi:hypothetical protein
VTPNRRQPGRWTKASSAISGTRSDTIKDTINDTTAISDSDVRNHIKDAVRGGGKESNEGDVEREIGRFAILNEGQGVGDGRIKEELETLHKRDGEMQQKMNGSQEKQQEKEEEEEEEEERQEEEDERVKQFEGMENENKVVDLGDVGALGEDGDRGGNVAEDSEPSEVKVEVEVEDDASKERYRMLKEKMQAARETATSILGTAHMYRTILSSIVLYFC